MCYELFNAGRRCPRELQCKHSFCETCLRAMLTHRGADEPPASCHRLILCPLCRYPTSVSEEGRVRAELRVDEGVLERLLAAGLLDRAVDESDEDQNVRSEEGGTTLPGCPQQGGVEAFSRSRGGSLRQSWKRVWRRISSKNSQRRDVFLSDTDLRSLAMMSCYMF